MARRPLAAALILGASALVLTGCLPMPPQISVAPPVTSGPIDPIETDEPTDPGATDEPSEPSEPSDGAYDFTVDDGLGDTWSYTVTGLEENPPIETGEPAAGSYLVAVVFDASHIEGSASFRTCFDIFVQGSDGQDYEWSDLGVMAENDLALNFDDEFTGGRAVLQLPEGVTAEQITVRSAFGHPEVADTIIDVQ